MRAAVALAAAVLTAGPAARAQPLNAGPMIPQNQLGQLQALQDMATREEVRRQNELSRLDARIRTQENLASLRAMSVAPPLPAPLAGAPPAGLAAGGFAQIPDAALAASNARVTAAAAGRR